MTCFHGKKAKKKIISKKKIQNDRIKKTRFFKIANPQYFFVKILWIGPWVSRINIWKRHWCGSTYTAKRLSDISSNQITNDYFNTQNYTHYRCTDFIFTKSSKFKLDVRFKSVRKIMCSLCQWGANHVHYFGSLSN